MCTILLLVSIVVVSLASKPIVPNSEPVYQYPDWWRWLGKGPSHPTKPPTTRGGGWVVVDSDADKIFPAPLKGIVVPFRHETRETEVDEDWVKVDWKLPPKRSAGPSPISIHRGTDSMHSSMTLSSELPMNFSGQMSSEDSSSEMSGSALLNSIEELPES